MPRYVFLGLAAAFVLAACETPTTQRYAISADNNMAIKALGTTGVGLATFTGPASFSATCRALGPLQVADGLRPKGAINQYRSVSAFRQQTGLCPDAIDLAANPA